MKTSGAWWKTLAIGAVLTIGLFVAGIALLAVVGDSDSQHFDMVGSGIENGAAPGMPASDGSTATDEMPFGGDEPDSQVGRAAPNAEPAFPAEPYSTDFGSANESYSYESESGDSAAAGQSYAYESTDEPQSYEGASGSASYGSSENTQSYGSAEPLYPGAPYSPADDEPTAQNAPPVASDREDLFDQKSGGGGYNTNSAPAADPMAEVERKLAALPLGNIAFNTPETIGMDDNATIELLVSLKEVEDALREAVRGAGAIESARVKLSNRMEARLSGMNFRIEAITPEQQVISSSERTAWRWQIEPTKSDKLELHLTLSALLTIDGEPTARAIRTFDRTIFVDVPFGQRLTNAATSHIELITSAVLIPILGGAYRQYRKRKRRTLPPPSADVPTRRAA